MCVIERGDEEPIVTSINPAAGKAGPSSGGQDLRLSEAEVEKAFPVKESEQERAQGAGLIERPSRRMALMQALLDLKLCAASCRALASPFSAPPPGWP